MRTARCLCLLALACGAWTATVPAAAAGQSIRDHLPTVRLISTGGTISNRPGSRLTATQLVEMVPQLDRLVIAEAEQFSNVASSALTIGDWLALSRRINSLFAARPDLDGVVVSSGTDTLEETAFFLHLTLRTDRPVVVVGSMRRPRTLGYEGSANLRQAFHVAASETARGRGVLVVMNYEINSARDVTKTSAQLLHAFRSPVYGALGVVDDDRVTFHRRIEHPHTAASEFDVSELRSLPRVDVLLSYLDAPGALLRTAVDSGAAGLVLAGFGAGGTSPSQREALRELTASGVPVVVTTRTGGGRVRPRQRAATGPRSVQGEPSPRPHLAGEDLSPIKARILLMLALTQTEDLDEIQRIFSTY